MVVLDTNIVIDFLRTKQGKQTILKTIIDTYKETDVAYSVLSIQELYAGQSTRNKYSLLHMMKTLTRFKCLIYSYDIAKHAGQIVRDSKIPVEFADAGIAATCISHNAQLATLNTKHFAHIPKLELLDLK